MPRNSCVYPQAFDRDVVGYMRLYCVCRATDAIAWFQLICGPCRKFRLNWRDAVMVVECVYIGSRINSQSPASIDHNVW